jgi:putative ABC transport system permease protein
MLKNYLIVTWRNLVRHKTYSLINLLGLAIGIAFCILSFLFVRHEWSFDRFHEHVDRIFRVNRVTATSGDKEINALTQVAVGPTLVEEFPEVVQAVRFRLGGTTVRHEERSFRARLLYADPGIFSMFSFPPVTGDLRSALQDKYSVVLSRETARKLFGDEDPLGKRIALGGHGKSADLTLTGVVEVPANSTLQFDLVVPLEYWPDYSNFNREEKRWGSGEVETFVRLAAGTGPAALEARFPAFVDVHLGELLSSFRRYYSKYDLALGLQPFVELRYTPQVEFHSWILSDPAYSRILTIISLGVLLIACINFTNLSMSLATTRFKEVGMRKVLGATRQQLARQFWGEALLLSFLALFAGVTLAELFLPVFSNLVSVKLSLEYGSLWPALLSLALVVGLLTGSYPALVLSRFQPVEVMEGRQRLGGTSPFSRLLVVLQFAPAIVLIVAALLMSRQLDFVMTKNLGFNPDQTVIIDTYYGTGLENRHLHTVFHQLVQQHPDIVQVSTSSLSFGHSSGNGLEVPREGKPELPFQFNEVDYDFLETLGMQVKAGRGFSREFPGDAEGAVLINEKMAAELGWADPVGRVLGSQNLEKAKQGNRALMRSIIGVVRDFHLFSLHQEVPPVAFGLTRGEILPPYIFVKIRPDNIPATLTLLKEAWQQAAPGLPFVYSFLDQDMERQYRTDQRWRTIVTYAALLAVFIACLGALGLASLAVARRTKEIGIRKVLGASVPSIVMLLSKEFTYLVLAANVIAWPLAWYALHRWLESFAYRIELGPGIFVLGGVLVLLIAWLTVSFQAIRAAMANPVEALRYE